MASNIGINGFGRIGRIVFRAMWARREEFNIVGINDLADAPTLAYLLKYDSIYGRFSGDVKAAGNALVVDGIEIPVTAEKDPAKLPWAARKVDVALECTGIFRTREACGLHLKAGARKVILSAPPKDEIDAVIVIGVNDETLKPEHLIVSNASCTTNCLAPVAKVLHETFGIKRGLMTTCHAYTNDQKILDQIHKDLPRARAAALNIIPTTTGAAKAVGKVIPALAGKLNGYALRVPTPVGSIVDLTAELAKPASVAAINAAMKQAAEGPLKGILGYTDDPIVSTDVIGTTVSSLFDACCTQALDETFVKVCSWYDNEWGFSNRMADLAKKLAAI
ncbi:MAG TPA: type I glyceraldehyde-3-phosphate dehydrogenase [Phycisphaerae bacterium]|nr:type I glyceraldehyde-3-phosphate dehydrogenase [Phycisphaerae bacterium]